MNSLFTLGKGGDPIQGGSPTLGGSPILRGGPILRGSPILRGIPTYTLVLQEGLVMYMLLSDSG